MASEQPFTRQPHAKCETHPIEGDAGTRHQRNVHGQKERPPAKTLIGNEEEADSETSFQFRNCGFLLLCSTTAARAPVTLLSHTGQFRSLQCFLASCSMASAVAPWALKRATAAPWGHPRGDTPVGTPPWGHPRGGTARPTRPGSYEQRSPDDSRAAGSRSPDPAST
jgi:hypothetical protein